MLILGIETSCDETSAAVVMDGRFVLSNVIRSSVELHKAFGGVVPEIAAREHLKIINVVIDTALKEASVVWDDIDAIAVTCTPGLIGSLLVGINSARTLALIYEKPLIELNHIHGHIYSNWLGVNDEGRMTKDGGAEFPLVVLTVSGGHNDLILMKGHHDFEVLGETIDDAAGEAFDKVAKLLGLGYPGGPIISRISEKGDARKYKFPRARLGDSYDFSFSGVKTAVLYTFQKIDKVDEQVKADIAASFQEAVADILSEKLIRAAEEHSVREIHMAGGVSANSRLRELIRSRAGDDFLVRFPGSLRYCTDNAAMIAGAGYFKKKFTTKNL